MSEQMPPERPGDKPFSQMVVSMTGASASDHETEPPGADPTSVRAGHEPDQFGIKGVLYVPLAVVATLVVAYLLTTGIFFNINKRAPYAADPNPQLIERNKVTLNESFARISSSDPKAESKQPRLEGLRQTGDEQDPAYMRSKLPLAEGNSPEMRPEDLRAENYVDPLTKQKILVEYGWADQGKRVARVPIGEAIKTLSAGKKLPTRKDAVRLNDTSDERAKLSNAGRGGPTQGQGMPVPTTPAAPKH
jgi:hypothetical protein